MKWGQQVFNVCGTIAEHSSDMAKVTADITQILGTFIFPLYKFVAAFQQPLNNTVEFTDITKAIVSFAQTLNLFVVKLKLKELTDVIKNFTGAFLQNKSLEEMLKQSSLLAQFFAPFGYGQNMDVVTSLIAMTSICASNPEMTAQVIASIARFASYVFPSLTEAEDLLNTLALKITDITKSIFTESRQAMLQLINIIDANLEYFNDEYLGEINYVLQTSKTILDFIPTDPNFVNQQQLFFDALGSLPSPLSKLASTCTEPDIKVQMQQHCEKLTHAGNRYANWLLQFYLTTSATVHLRADTVQGILSFPMGIFQTMSMQQYIASTTEAVKTIQTIMGSAPVLQSFEADGIVKLINQLNNFAQPGQQFIDLSNRNAESPSFPLFKIASTALAKANTRLPSMASQLASLMNFANAEAFVCSIISFTTRAIALSQSVQQLVDRADVTALYFMSIPFTMALLVDSFQQKQQPLAEPLTGSINFLKSTTEVIWPLVKSIASGEDNKDRVNLPTFFQKFITNLNDLLASIAQLPQPVLAYKIPADIQEIKKFDAMADNIHSTLVKSFAKYIIRRLKRSKSSDARSVLMQWFDATQVQTVEVADGLKKMNNAIMKLITSATTDRSAFLEAFTSLSVSLAATENSYGKTVSPHIQKLHKELVDLIIELLENARGTAQAQYMKIIACATQIRALAPISKLKQKEIEKYSATIIQQVINALNVLRMKGKDATLQDSIAAVEALSEFAALSLVAPQDIDASSLLKSITQSKSDHTLVSFIQKFSEKLAHLEPSMFYQLEGIRDSDTVCDFVYDKAELFRDEVNLLLTFAKTPKADQLPQVYVSLKKMLVCAADATVLTMHSLMLGGLAFTPLSRVLVECFAELMTIFVEFVVLAEKIPTSKTDLSADIRRLNRKMSKQFDTLINIVESPQRPTGEINEFDQTRNQMYADLSTAAIQLARLAALSANALVPEMWVGTRGEIVDTLNAAISQLTASVSAVRGKAVGASSTELGTQFSALTKGIPDIQKASETLNFVSPFASNKLFPSLKNISTTLLGITKISPFLTDRIIIEPDPASAAKVPEKYELPPLPDKAISPTDALDEMDLAKRQLEQGITEFKKVTDANLTPSGELLHALLTLTKLANSFAEKALGMARATADTRSQVEQQATLHGFSNAITALQNAMRSRLLRAPNFEREMEDAINSLRNSSDSSMRVAVDASKIEVNAAPEDESMDEVTRELAATSKAIEDMTSRLSQFAQQVDVVQPVDETHEIPDIQAAAGTLPAFLVASAQPIFQATAKILVRAREITAQLIAKFGKIDNEAGMIKVAQDLTEAAELLIICAEILVNGGEEDAEFKVIAAARIIKGAVASLVAQVLVKGGDAEGIMSMQVKIVARHTDAIIAMAEKIVTEKLNEADAKAPKKAVKNPMIQKLNMQQTVNQQRKVLQEEEKNLYTFRRRGNK
ncbi:I/LWEQ domain family [Trichomonas vaginalis G3]|nr:I/LWEQ domain family [Trichomonas vaginalis G3]KAI5533522.1 I/LWEQ domain family [Trichomonas vaginalis G3]